jgi:two-component system LytT family sensor kinase
MELGKSDANLGFLKSQINPHFLFNALNTLYGTALQENAERTGEGIQKLGDMMRFMLQENMQDKISLSRDIDYLNNYIALQKLRTSVSVDIVINTEIEEQLSALEITPMLLIPFVENAFKHGISLQSPSHIKVTLQTKGDTLYFDVNNSIHLKADGDPEKLNSGIGLQNVKQRLALLYPNKHELIIRESAKEFFVHLTLNLK